MASSNSPKTSAKPSRKSRTALAGTDTPALPATRPTRLLTAREVMLHLHNEHKYMTKLLNILKEQSDMIDRGNAPDFAIMADIVRYMNEYSDTTHHAKEDIIYRKLSERDDSHKAEVVSLLIEHEGTARKTEGLLNSIREAQRNPDRENLKTLRFRCDDYVASMNTHMDFEESQVFPRVLGTLTESDWESIIHEIQPGSDPLFGKNVEKRYQELFQAISSEMERAAEDFTMAELVGLGAAMENIGVIATYGNTLGKVVKQRFRQAYRGNVVAYRKLLKARSRNVGDYMSVTVDCMLNNFDTYTDTLRDVSRILRKARTQIAEPYTTRLRIYHDMVRTPVNPGDKDPVL